MLGRNQQLVSLAAPPPLDTDKHALFLDLDGTLVDFAARPEHVVASEDLRCLLMRLAQAMNGALALITGRTIASADTVLHAALLHVAGVHGFELRSTSGVARAFDDISPLTTALVEARTLASSGALNADIEDKGAALALHYRRTPHCADATRRTAASLAERHGLNLVEGKMVIELKLGNFTKADAVRRFMRTAPFAGRLPIGVGDDITDEDAFREVAELGGRSILVGEERPTAAHWRLADTRAVYTWLEAGLAS